MALLGGITVLNLIINGIPSIHDRVASSWCRGWGFKPCYKWNTFNTKKTETICMIDVNVLNLVLIGFFNIVISRRNKSTKLLIYRFY